MLCETNSRYSAQDVLNHVWVHSLAPNATETVLNLNLKNLVDFKKANNLKRAVLTFIASRLKDEDVMPLKEIFMSLDSDQNGTLTMEEVKQGISQLADIRYINVEEIFKSLDTHRTGVVHYTEFLAAAMDPTIYLKEERLYEAFKAFDKHGIGRISINDLKEVIKGDEIELGNLGLALEEFDNDNDGQIDYNEFIMMMSKLEA